MTKIYNGIKTDKQIKREALLDRVIKNTVALACGAMFIMFIDQPANAAIIVDKPHNANCYEFKTVQDIDAIAVAEFDSQYSEDIDDYFKVYYTNKTADADGKREVLTEEAYNKKRSDLKSKIMLSPCLKTQQNK